MEDHKSYRSRLSRLQILFEQFIWDLDINPNEIGFCSKCGAIGFIHEGNGPHEYDTLIFKPHMRCWNCLIDRELVYTFPDGSRLYKTYSYTKEKVESGCDWEDSMENELDVTGATRDCCAKEYLDYVEPFRNCFDYLDPEIISRFCINTDNGSGRWVSKEA